MKKTICILTAAALSFCILCGCAAKEERKTVFPPGLVLSELSEEECMDFLLASGADVPDQYRDAGGLVKEIVKEVEEDPYAVIWDPVSMPGLRDFMRIVRNAVNTYYGIRTMYVRCWSDEVWSSVFMRTDKVLMVQLDTNIPGGVFELRTERGFLWDSVNAAGGATLLYDEGGACLAEWHAGEEEVTQEYDLEIVLREDGAPVGCAAVKIVPKEDYLYGNEADQMVYAWYFMGQKIFGGDVIQEGLNTEAYLNEQLEDLVIVRLFIEIGAVHVDEFVDDVAEIFGQRFSDLAAGIFGSGGAAYLDEAVQLRDVPRPKVRPLRLHFGDDRLRIIDEGRKFVQFFFAHHAAVKLLRLFADDPRAIVRDMAERLIFPVQIAHKVLRALGKAHDRVEVDDLGRSRTRVGVGFRKQAKVFSLIVGRCHS